MSSVKRRKVPKRTSQVSNKKPEKSFVKTGELKTLLEMPLDILYEVCSHLTMSSILNMAHTTKALRTLLMSKAWSSVWRAVLANDPDEFPPKPDDINEPQYVALICGLYCFKCGSGKDGNSPLWCARQTLCYVCRAEAKFVSNVQHFVLTFLASKSADDLPPQFDRLGFQTLVIRDGTEYAESCQVDDVQDTYMALKQCSDATETDKFIKQRLKIVERHHKFRDDCRDAIIRRRHRLSKELETARRLRKENIVHRLRAAGYSEELNYLETAGFNVISSHPDVFSPVAMTDEIFNDIFPRLSNLLLPVREELLRAKRNRLFNTRLQTLLKMLTEHISDNPREISPSLSDIAFMPAVKSILDTKDVNAYATEDSLAHIKADLPRMCEKWRRSANRALASVMPRTLNTGHLSLAISIFQCQECLEPIPYPQILAHSCLRELRTGYRNREDSVVALLKALNEEPWNFEPRDGVQWHGSASPCAVDVVVACGLPVETTTPEDMDRAAIQWLECMECRNTNKMRSLVCQWRNAVLHGVQHLAQGHAATWSPVTCAADVQAAEEEEERRTVKHGPSHYVCVRCDVKIERRMRREHLRLLHNIEHPSQLGDDFVLAFDAPMAHQPYTVLIPLTKPPSKSLGCIDLTDDNDAEAKIQQLEDGSILILDD